MYILGVTGGIGSGKSEVCRYLEKKYGAAVLIADEIAKAAIEPGTKCYEGLKEIFGDEYFLKDGRLDRKKAGERAFKDEDILRQMNELIHPAVHDMIEERLERARGENRSLVVIEAAILLESGYGEICDETWYVCADVDERIRRLVDARGITRERAEAIMKNQLRDVEFRKLCDHTLDNGGDFSDTERRIDARVATRFGL